jgi:hypothetical protein
MLTIHIFGTESVRKYERQYFCVATECFVLSTLNASLRWSVRFALSDDASFPQAIEESITHMISALLRGALPYNGLL